LKVAQCRKIDFDGREIDFLASEVALQALDERAHRRRRMILPQAARAAT
jgi:hypothetical protein